MKEKKPAKTSTGASSRVLTPERLARRERISRLMAEGIKNLGKKPKPPEGTR